MGVSIERQTYQLIASFTVESVSKHRHDKQINQKRHKQRYRRFHKEVEVCFFELRSFSPVYLSRLKEIGG